jgi:hypothetical protein
MTKPYNINSLSDLVAECDIERNPSERARYNVYRTEFIAYAHLGNGLNITIRAQRLQFFRNGGGIPGFRDKRPSLRELLFNPYSGRYEYETHPSADMKRVSWIHHRLKPQESKQLFKFMKKKYTQQHRRS